MKADSLFSRDEAIPHIAYSSILLIAIIWWCLLGRVPLTVASIFSVFIFCNGVTSWASICRHLWPSQYSLNNYLPFGYALCSLASFALIMLKQGTVASCLMGSLLGVFLFCIKNVIRAQRQIDSGHESFQAGITNRSVIALVLTAMYTTFLLANQITSIHGLRNVAVNTTINTWADVTWHANTVLSLSSLPQGQLPISPFDHADSIVPYHYSSYILSSLFSSVSPQASPLESFVSILVPLGCLLMLLPLADQALKAKTRHASITFLGSASSVFLIYSLWVRLLGDSWLDPAWLLITAPATMYACAITLSGIQICTETHKRGSIPLNGLVLLGFLLTVFTKIQIAHALLPMVVVIVISAGFSILKRNQRLPLNHTIYIPLASVAFLAALHLHGNSVLGLGRKHPIGEVMTFFGVVVARAWGHLKVGHISVLNIDWIAPLLGFMTLCGPLFLIALISGVSGPSRQSFGVRVLILAAFSYAVSLLLSPSMPWDDGEFLNRSWPLLWCLGVWAILDRCPLKLNKKLPQQWLITGSVITVALGWLFLPGPKKESIASPPKPDDWSKVFYPTTFKSTEIKLAQDLRRSGNKNFFFASSSLKKSYSKVEFDDLPSRIAALSGARPLLSRVLFQKSMQVHHAKNGLELSVESRYNQILSRYGAACASSADLNSPIKLFEEPTVAPKQNVYVVCQDLEAPSL